MASDRQIIAAMRRNVSECEDPQTGEVNMTQLAEMVADELDCSERLDDGDDSIWDHALNVAEAHQKKQRYA